MNLIREIHDCFPYYGYRKIHAELVQKHGYQINRKRVQRLLIILGIKAIYPGPKTSKPGGEGCKVFPYLLKGLMINKANYVWSIDITYIKLPVGVVYFIALIVGSKLANTMEAYHVVEVMEKAVMSYGCPVICNVLIRGVSSQGIYGLKNY